MTADSARKRAVRALMAQRGISYTEAARQYDASLQAVTPAPPVEVWLGDDLPGWTPAPDGPAHLILLGGSHTRADAITARLREHGVMTGAWGKDVEFFGSEAANRCRARAAPGRLTKTHADPARPAYFVMSDPGWFLNRGQQTDGGILIHAVLAKLEYLIRSGRARNEHLIIVLPGEGAIDSRFNRVLDRCPPASLQEP